VNMRKLVYVNCRNGHWYHGPACPIDGYSDELTRRINGAVGRLLEQGDTLTFAAVIKAAELNERQASRLMVIELLVEDDEPRIFVERYE
jgi:hypothetical protein